jgi:hypothetical protein
MVGAEEPRRKPRPRRPRMMGVAWIIRPRREKALCSCLCKSGLGNWRKRLMGAMRQGLQRLPRKQEISVILAGRLECDAVSRWADNWSIAGEIQHWSRAWRTE